jgi:hypothetical protein
MDFQEWNKVEDAIFGAAAAADPNWPILPEDNIERSKNYKTKTTESAGAENDGSHVSEEDSFGPPLPPGSGQPENTAPSASTSGVAVDDAPPPVDDDEAAAPPPSGAATFGEFKRINRRPRGNYELRILVAGGESVPLEVYPLLEGQFRQQIEEAVDDGSIDFAALTGMGEMEFDVLFGGARIRAKAAAQLVLVASFVPRLEIPMPGRLYTFEVTQHMPKICEPVRVRVKTILVQALGPQVYLRQVLGRIPGIEPDDYRFGSADPPHRKFQQILIFASPNLQDVIRDNFNRVPNPGGDLPCEFPGETRENIARKKAAKADRDLKFARERAEELAATARGEKECVVTRSNGVKLDLEEAKLELSMATEPEEKAYLSERIKAHEEPARLKAIGASFLASLKRPARAPLGAQYPAGSSEEQKQQKRLDMRSKAADKKARENKALDMIHGVKQATREVAMAAAREAAAAEKARGSGPSQNVGAPATPTPNSGTQRPPGQQQAPPSTPRYH